MILDIIIDLGRILMNVIIVLSITMPLESWKRLSRQLSHTKESLSYPALNLGRVIDKLVKDLGTTLHNIQIEPEE